ncbi:L-rhamnose mutarotase [Pedobacter sp. Leaf176]|uniref:L-rhamnose mutarotase n=1 Tax=Pedobacter sp. Leaf176 TaxID=1736286 RepID=UPI0006F7E295|nr:L-rhamnose mutarotase [Pedobacter sp. Leaf176]KQR71381.1 L-rhamnose mutarotase [Pedobacter sp. Leaf176]
MVRIAFKMKLFSGYEQEYEKRHKEIWPELAALLSETGITDYSIFHDKNTNDLFAVLKIANPELIKKLPEQPIMQKWWAFMGDIMESNPDNSPVSLPLKEVFYLA